MRRRLDSGSSAIDRRQVDVYRRLVADRLQGGFKCVPMDRRRLAVPYSKKIEEGNGQELIQSDFKLRPE